MAINYNDHNGETEEEAGRRDDLQEHMAEGWTWRRVVRTKSRKWLCWNVINMGDSSDDMDQED